MSQTEQYKPKHRKEPLRNLSRRDFVLGGASAILLGTLYKDTGPDIPFDQDPLPFYNPKEKIPPREVLVTANDVKKSYDNLKPYTMETPYGTLFRRELGSDDITSAWNTQHPLAAIHQYSQLNHTLPTGLPEPTDVTRAYWNEPYRKADWPIGYNIIPQKYTDHIYNDDGAWLALIDAERYCMLREMNRDDEAGEVLHRTRQMVQTAWKSWDETTGGIYWKIPQPRKENRDKATVSNAPVASVALRLYDIDPDYKESHLQKAITIYDWMRTNLWDSQTNLYYDRMEKHEGKDVVIKDYMTYGQANMIDVGIRLARITGEKKYEEHAEATAMELLTNRSFYTQPLPVYDSILLRSFFSLYQTTENKHMKSLLKDRIILYGNNIVRNRKVWDRESGKYKRTSIFLDERDVQSQAAIAEILLITHYLKDH